MTRLATSSEAGVGKAPRHEIAGEWGAVGAAGSMGIWPRRQAGRGWIELPAPIALPRRMSVGEGRNEGSGRCRTRQAGRGEPVLFHAGRSPQSSRPGPHPSHPRRPPAARSDRGQSCWRTRVSRWPGMSSGRCSALPEPDPLDEATALIHAAVLEFGPKETLPPVGVISPRHARSPDRTARSAPHTGGKSPAFRRERAKSRETQTLRWRGVDSNFRFRDALSSPTARPWSRRLIRR